MYKLITAALLLIVAGSNTEQSQNKKDWLLQKAAVNKAERDAKSTKGLPTREQFRTMLVGMTPGEVKNRLRVPLSTTGQSTVRSSWYSSWHCYYPVTGKADGWQVTIIDCPSVGYNLQEQ